MSSTARDIVVGALRLLGASASGEALGAAEATDGLSAFNDMLDSWSTEKLLIPNKVREVFALIAGQSAYTIGTGGNFNTSRPTEVENALLQVTSSSPALEIPMKILTKDQYAGILLKTLQSTYPLYLYAEGTFPLETINVWPVPSGADNIVLYSSKQLANLTDINTALSLPPGYNRALRFNLAIELAPEYGKAASAEIVEIASQSKANIKRMNSKKKYLQVDEALRAKPAVWNWMTGEPT